jgi:inosine-uridine nucleoside N-ribohydrolase
MAQKVVLIADPGIDTSFAIALAFCDPNLDVVGVIATPGNIPAEQATVNVRILVNQLDPPKWPKVGAALPVIYDLDGTKLHGPNGLGGIPFPAPSLHQPPRGDQVLVDLIREYPNELSLVIMGPCTMFARALDRDPDLPRLLEKIIVLGGCWHAPGNAGPMKEFHFACDPDSARQVLRSGGNITLVPLDVTQQIIFSPADLFQLPNPESTTCQFLRQIVPFGIRATSNIYGIEGFHLKDVVAIAALARPNLLRVQPLFVDVETHGELSRGMSIVDALPNSTNIPNVDWGREISLDDVRKYINDTLQNEGS